MHRKSILIVIVILALTFLACGGSDDSGGFDDSVGNDSSIASDESNDSGSFDDSVGNDSSIASDESDESDDSSGFKFEISFGDTASIEYIGLGRGYDSDNLAPVEPTDVFTTEDSEFHCVVELASAPDGTKLKVVWTSIDSALGQNKQMVELEQEIKDSSYIPDFTFTATPGLPAGLHKVDVYLDNQLDSTLEFTVEES